MCACTHITATSNATVSSLPPGDAAPGGEGSRMTRGGSKKPQLDKGRDRFANDHMVDDHHADQVKCLL